MKFVINNNNDKMQLIDHLKGLKNNYIVEVKKKRNTRSNNANGYYWACIVQPLSQELGYFPDEMHDALKIKFSSEWEMVEVNNKQVGLQTIKSTRIKDTKEFEVYLEQIRIWALTELDIRLMLPNEYE